MYDFHLIHAMSAYTRLMGGSFLHKSGSLHTQVLNITHRYNTGDMNQSELGAIIELQRTAQWQLGRNAAPGRAVVRVVAHAGAGERQLRVHELHAQPAYRRAWLYRDPAPCNCEH